MASKQESIYHTGPKLTGDLTITLNADERSMICAALAKCAPWEVDIMPLALLMDRLVKSN